MTTPPLFKALIEAGNTALLWQTAVIVLSFLLAGLIIYVLRRHPPAINGEPKRTPNELRRVLWSLATLLLLVIGKAVLARWFKSPLIEIAIALFVAFALVQIAIYGLRRLFAPADWLRNYERFITAVILLGLGLHLTGFLPEILQTLDDLSVSIGRHRFSLLLVVQGFLFIVITLLSAMWLGRYLAQRILGAERLDHNFRILAAKFIRAVLIFAGILIALPLAGIDITVLSVFGGALGVGLGFGLQKVASNYISGFIILLDHSIHIGDIVTVDQHYGTVSRLTARYMVLRGPDGTESLIPNEILITSTVVNHSYSDRKVRLLIPVQISYESPIEIARQALLEAAQAHPSTLRDPPPQVLVHELNNIGIRLELSLWAVDSGDGLGKLRSDVNQQIWESFMAKGIEIAYSQHHIKILKENPAHGPV